MNVNQIEIESDVGPPIDDTPPLCNCGNVAAVDDLCRDCLSHETARLIRAIRRSGFAACPPENE